MEKGQCRVIQEELDALLEDMRKGGELEVLSQRDNPLLNVSFDQPVMNNVSLADAMSYNISNSACNRVQCLSYPGSNCSDRLALQHRLLYADSCRIRECVDWRERECDRECDGIRALVSTTHARW